MNLVYRSTRNLNKNKSLLNILPIYKFSTLDLQKLDFSKYFNVTMETNQNEEISFEFPNLTNPTSRPIIIQTEDTDVGSLIEGIVENVDYISGLEAYTLDQKQLSKQTLLSDLEGDNFYLIDKSKKIYLIQNQDKYQVDSYQNIGDYCEKIELSFLERKVISNYLRRFDEQNQQTTGQKIFSDHGQQQKSVVFNKDQIIQNLVASLPNHKNIQTENEQALFEQYIELQQNIEYMKSQKKMMEDLVHTSEKRKMALGLIALIGNFTFVGVGTYSIWSWDIVEPMAFFLQFSGFAYLSFHFFKFKKDYSNDDYLEWRKGQALIKVAQQNNFDLKKLEDMEVELAELEKKIKANVLIHL